MDALQELGRLDIVPVSGTFDVEAIAARIEQLGFSFRDKEDPSRFVVTTDAATRDFYRERRRADPDSDFPHLLLIGVKPKGIFVAPSMFEDEEPLALEFLGWLSKVYRCRISDANGTELPGLVQAGQ